MKKITIFSIVGGIMLLTFGLITYVPDIFHQLEYEKLEARTEVIIETELQPKIDEITNAFNNHKEVFITFQDAFSEESKANIGFSKNEEVRLTFGDEVTDLMLEDLPIEQQTAFRELQGVISFKSILYSSYQFAFNYYNGEDGPPWTWVYLYYNEHFSAEENSNDDWIFLDDHWFIERGVGWGV